MICLQSHNIQSFKICSNPEAAGVFEGVLAGTVCVAVSVGLRKSAKLKKQNYLKVNTHTV